ncbi:hypothetical protein KFK09_014296 [Dendrobium nobile]|uniref:BTB/POZ domain-containing protein n=1 Tax=Dendrobium nobile TaxID=94219 RepID=A0A8T3BC67_DENNO|nr:hypothetical protein KFK09_014296 [Dendrobium nobile]
MASQSLHFLTPVNPSRSLASSPFLRPSLLPVRLRLFRSSAAAYTPPPDLNPSPVLAAASPVLENMISGQTIKILGAPYDAVLVFVRFLNAGEARRPPPEATEAMNLYGVQLLALAHAYRIGWLKRLCEAAVGGRVGLDDVVEVMKLAQLCDAPQLRRRCLAVAAKDFAALQRTEGWRFVQNHDPRLELEILQFMAEREQRRKRWRRERLDQEVFLQLSEAMECYRCTVPSSRGRQ